MRKSFKTIASFILIPLTRWYLKKECRFVKDGIRVRVFPGVFHPGLFNSTLFLYRYLNERDVLQKTLLELGCGSGFLSIAAAKRGAQVTALDLNMKAVQNTALNAIANNVVIKTLHSDLFSNVLQQTFDWIVINPPYYARDAENEEALAWYCGEHYEYFVKLFDQMPRYTTGNSEVVMVLTRGCNIDAIKHIAKLKGYKMVLVRTKKVFFDGEDFLFHLDFVS